jgi:hypothetical protein
MLLTALPLIQQIISDKDQALSLNEETLKLALGSACDMLQNRYRILEVWLFGVSEGLEGRHICETNLGGEIGVKM